VKHDIPDMLLVYRLTVVSSAGTDILAVGSTQKAGLTASPFHVKSWTNGLGPNTFPHNQKRTNDQVDP
jgi:hypothetical protein